MVGEGFCLWWTTPLHPVSDQGQFGQAEPLYQRAQEIVEKSLGRDHPNLAPVLKIRALMLKNQGGGHEKFLGTRKARLDGERVGYWWNFFLGINNALLGRAYPKRCTVSELRDTAIVQNTLSPDHPRLVTQLINRPALLCTVSAPIQRHHTDFVLFFLVTFQGKYEEAEPLHVRSLAIREKVLGPDDPEIATSLKATAALLQSQVRAIRNG